MKIGTIFLFLMTFLTASSLKAENYYNGGYFENQTLTGENIFSGTITIKGRLTIQEGSKLTILPGTKLIFLFIDEDGDGIGESEILSQGEIKVLGTKEEPVHFFSDVRKKGAWLGFSIMSVDNESLIQYAKFEDAYMALHSHFSTLKVSNCTFSNNFRGFQSQEGTITLVNNEFFDNNTGVQFRNSKSLLKGNKIYKNMGGLNFLYSTVEMENNDVFNNRLFGIKIRFSKVTSKGLKVFSSMQNIYGKNSEIEMHHTQSIGALLRGFSFEDSQIFLSESNIENNLLDGISLDKSILNCQKVTFKNNGRFQIYLKGESKVKGTYSTDRSERNIYVEH